MNRDDVRVERFRGKGPGGQHRNKTETCVRLTHVPTGVVACGTSERSLSANLKAAEGLLQARLADRLNRLQTEEIARRRKERGLQGFGAAVRRSYYLAGEARVVDPVSGAVADPKAVLAGRLDLVWRNA